MPKPTRRNQPNAIEKKESGAIQPEVLPPTPPEQLITQRVVQILVEKDDPEEIKKLMDAELAYNRERFAIFREHAEHHPDAIELRKSRIFRRTQYIVLLSILVCLLGGIAFVPFAVASIFGIICILIVSGVLLNARERDIDLTSFVRIIETIVGRRQ